MNGGHFSPVGAQPPECGLRRNKITNGARTETRSGTTMRQLRRAWTPILSVVFLMISALALRAGGGIENLTYSSDITTVLGGVIVAPGTLADDTLDGTVALRPLDGLPDNVNIDAYHRMNNGHQLFSLYQTVILPGGIPAGPEDVVRWDGAAFSLFFDGSGVGVPNGVNVDAAGIGPSGDLIVSFDTTVFLDGETFADEDVVAFGAEGFRPFLMASEVGVPPFLDLDALHSTGSSLLLSFDTSGEIAGISFDDEDVLEIDDLMLGWSLAYDGSAFHGGWAAADLDALFAGGAVVTHLLTGVCEAAGCQGLISPGSIASVFGDFTGQTAVADGIPLSLDLNGFSVTFNGVPGALFGVFDDPRPGFDQANVQVPWDIDVSGGTVQVKVHWEDGGGAVWSEVFVANAARASPGIFMLPSLQAIVTNFSLGGDDVIAGSWAQPEGFFPGVSGQPAPIGGVITIWCGGLGPVTETPATGDMPRGPLPLTTKIVRVFIGGVEADIIGGSGILHPTSVGLNQINAFVPDGVTAGDTVPIVIEVECEDGTILRSREDATIAVRARP